MCLAPKINWTSTDRFNIADYNRIKNNIEYLFRLASSLYGEIVFIEMGEDKKKAEFFYADEINNIEDNLDTINKKSIMMDYGNKKHYVSNGVMIDFIELNRIESATLDLYNKLTNAYEGRKKLTFCLGGD